VIKKPLRRRPMPDLGCRAIGWMKKGLHDTLEIDTVKLTYAVRSEFRLI
jgi:hypothetical protein